MNCLGCFNPHQTTCFPIQSYVHFSLIHGRLHINTPHMWNHKLSMVKLLICILRSASATTISRTMNGPQQPTAEDGGSLQPSFWIWLKQVAPNPSFLPWKCGANGGEWNGDGSGRAWSDRRRGILALLLPGAAGSESAGIHESWSTNHEAIEHH